MFLTRRFFILATLLVLFLAAGWWWAPLFRVVLVLLCLFALFVLVDLLLLWLPLNASHRASHHRSPSRASHHGFPSRASHHGFPSRASHHGSPSRASHHGFLSRASHHRSLTASRQLPARFSNGDDNVVTLHIHNGYPFTARLEVIDEAPVVFQRRDIVFHSRVAPHRDRIIRYKLRPVRRGDYAFGHIRVFVSTALGLIQRRYTLGKEQTVKVYPSFLMLRQVELLAFTNRLTELGIKRIRRPGNNTEFEQIKDYVPGDDYRTINWKATARRQHLMVNSYNQERSLPVYNVIDMGRMMQQTSRRMTYLDYAINAALVLSFVAMNKHDRAGLITFDDKVETVIPVDRRPGHIETLLNSLYAQHTVFAETDFSALLTTANSVIPQRSLLIVYTNFATQAAMHRQLPWLRQLARRHRLLVVIFADEEIRDYLRQPKQSTEDYYRHVVAAQAVDDQRCIVAELRQLGISSLLTTPPQLSVDVINKYLEMKDRI